MSPCILIHGGWCGGWHWDPVVSRLTERGLTAYAPTLPGMAERIGEATPDTGLHAHIADITRFIERLDLSEVVLVGHSYGGAVITGVAHGRCADRISELVYLDAFILRDGESLADILGPGFLNSAQDAARRSGTPHLVPPMFSVGEVTGWTGEKAEALAARMCPTPLATATDNIHVRQPSSARRTYIACKANPLGLFDRDAVAAREDEDWSYCELPSPHDAVHVMPAVVVGIIETLAEPASGWQ